VGENKQMPLRGGPVNGWIIGSLIGLVVVLVVVGVLLLMIRGARRTADRAERHRLVDG